jgi:hypothetical protein
VRWKSLLNDGPAVTLLERGFDATLRAVALFTATSEYWSRNSLGVMDNALAMGDSEISEAGIFAAVFLSLVATIGAFLTSGRMINNYDWLWIGVFLLSLVTLSGAVVNFDLKRLIK